MPRPTRKPAPQTVSWTSDDGETVVMPVGVTPADTHVETSVDTPAPAANGVAHEEPESAADRVIEMIIRNRERDRSKIKVWKVLDTGDLAFCNDYSPDVFEAQNLNLIRRQFGPGKYRVEVYAHHPEKKRLLCFGRETVHIAHVEESTDPEDIAERIAQRMGAVAPAPPPANGQGSNLAQFKDMFELFALMHKAFAPAPPPPQPPMATQLAELLNIMKGARELAAEVDPPPEQADPLLKLAEQAMPIIARSIEQQTQRPPVLAPVQLPPTLAPNQPGEAAVTNDEFTALREALKGINTLAVMGANVELSANLIFDKLPDEAFPILEGPDWFGKLCQVEPSCTKHQAWYQQVRDLVVKYWNEPLEQDDDQAADLPAAA